MKNETFRLMLHIILVMTLRLLKPLARVRNKSFYASSGTTQRGMPPIVPQDRDWLFALAPNSNFFHSLLFTIHSVSITEMFDVRRQVEEVSSPTIQHDATQ
jgi:ABC-type cobalt transport system substrate-binding protein